MSSRAIDLFMVYQIVKRIVMPFEKWDAFKYGIIDRNGTVLRSRETLTKKEEQNAWGYFDIMVANLKKLLAKVPGGSHKLTQTAAAILLLREGEEFEKDFNIKLQQLIEEAPTNAAGGGNVAGIGVGAQGEPGVIRHRHRFKRRVVLHRILRRRKRQNSAN